MLQETTDSILTLSRNSVLIDVNFDVGIAIFLSLFDLKDSPFLLQHSKDGIGSSDMSLHPLIVLDVVILKALDGTDDEIEPADIDDIPSLLLRVLGKQGLLNVLKYRKVKSHRVSLALFVR